MNVQRNDGLMTHKLRFSSILLKLYSTTIIFEIGTASLNNRRRCIQRNKHTRRINNLIIFIDWLIKSTNKLVKI